MTLDDSITSVRLALSEPDTMAPNPRIVLTKLQDVTQLLHLNMQNSAIAWDVANFQISTVVGQADYLVPAAPEVFGKDFRVLAIDPNNIYHAPWEVRRCDMGDNDNFYNGPERATAAGHSAVICNFYRMGGGIYLKLVPTPAEAGKVYEVWYETAGQPMDSLADSPTLAPFQRYRNLKAASAILPHCRWTGMDAATMALQMKAIDGKLQEQITDYKKQWDDWISSDRFDGTTERIGYASGYDYTY